MATITTQDTEQQDSAVRICFRRGVHPAHDNCRGIDEDTYFERMLDAAS